MSTTPPLAAGSHTFFTIGNFEILGSLYKMILIHNLLNDRFYCYLVPNSTQLILICGRILQ